MLQYQEQEFAQGKFPVPADEAIRPLVMDDKFLLWRDAISRVAARYLCDAQGHLHMNCQGVPGEGVGCVPGREEGLTAVEGCDQQGGRALSVGHLHMNCQGMVLVGWSEGGGARG